jgi:hypothetical protein
VKALGRLSTVQLGHDRFRNDPREYVAERAHSRITQGLGASPRVGIVGPRSSAHGGQTGCSPLALIRGRSATAPLLHETLEGITRNAHCAAKPYDLKLTTGGDAPKRQRMERQKSGGLGEGEDRLLDVIQDCLLGFLTHGTHFRERARSGGIPLI